MVDTVTEQKDDATFEEVKTQVLKYIVEHKNAKTSDIIFNLDFDPELIIDVLDSLENDGKVKSSDIQLTGK
ncbi:MAG: hypothetical protein FWH37_01735 [Candidatus Bathyarchaeota archaeon]|nr:hypothetical protein [Candidatus Termiticorpusculum sp.]